MHRVIAAGSRPAHPDGGFCPGRTDPTEFNLLEAFLSNPGYTLTRDELLEKAMGYAYEGMGRALDTHIRNLRRKIEPDPENPTYIQTVYGVGYRLTGERSEPSVGAPQLDDERRVLPGVLYPVSSIILEPAPPVGLTAGELTMRAKLHPAEITRRLFAGWVFPCRWLLAGGVC